MKKTINIKKIDFSGMSDEELQKIIKITQDIWMSRRWISINKKKSGKNKD